MATAANSLLTKPTESFIVDWQKRPLCLQHQLCEAAFTTGIVFHGKPDLYTSS